MNTLKALFLGLALGVVAGSAALAQSGPPGDRGDTPGQGFGQGGSKAVPGPIAGVGLAGWLGVAGYYWIVRRRRSRTANDTTT